jgi:hypothetical protein
MSMFWVAVCPRRFWLLCAGVKTARCAFAMFLGPLFTASKASLEAEPFTDSLLATPKSWILWLVSSHSRFNTSSSNRSKRSKRLMPNLTRPSWTEAEHGTSTPKSQALGASIYIGGERLPGQSSPLNPQSTCMPSRHKKVETKI